MTPLVLSKLEEAFALGCTDLEACFFAELGAATLYKYQDKHPEFVERKEALKLSPVLKARRSVISGFEESPELALKYLERKKKDEFSLKQLVDVTSDGKQIMQPVIISPVAPRNAEPEEPNKHRFLRPQTIRA
jgi:hypothetical protein